MLNLGFARDHTYAVMGLGKSGAVAARALAAAGATVFAWDDSADRCAALQGVDGATVVDLAQRGLGGVDALVLSPGIPHTHPEPHPVAAAAKAVGVPIIGDVELLLRALPDRRLVAITGTNGKSTTTALIGHILASANVPVEVGGNLGRPALEFADPGPNGVVVLELSSYQLELTPSLAPTVAVWLNITPDHIDRHGSLAGYVAAKRRIFAHQTPRGLAVIGNDDAHSRDVADRLRRDGRRIFDLSGVGPVVGGVYAEDSELIDARSGRPETVLSLTEAPALPGEHNAQNAAAAFAACAALGIQRSAIADGIRSFPGLAHRQERIAEAGGVLYVNDSKATNADAAARALACYSAIYWIAGGRGKEGGVSSLAPFFPRIRKAYLIGESAGTFAREIGDDCPTGLCRTLEMAVRQAHLDAQADPRPGAVVLLSPAAASFDQFPNFEVRGDRFRTLVRDLLDGNGAGDHAGERRAS
ncbi:UDP-N-acetylmuramoylalanine--D-glutamate ligase [alpha proteobacterium BAL199]|nr:UDP-N-acetylmuramoylalanine--D-glutamate ligase [alpha proteobacterium BAL199]